MGLEKHVPFNTEDFCVPSWWSKKYKTSLPLSLSLSLSLSLGIVVLKPVQMMMIIQHITSNAPTMRCSHHSFLPPIHSEIIPFIKQFMIFKPQFIPLSRGMYSTCSNLKDPLIHVITVYSRIFAYQYMLDVDGVNGNQRLWKRWKTCGDF